jgi:hypothetical protein
MELEACSVMRDRTGQQLAYVYFDEAPGRPAAELLTKDEAQSVAVNTSYNKQPSASTIYARVTRNEGCASMNGMGVRRLIHAMTKRISEMIKTNDFGACKDI